MTNPPITIKVLLDQTDLKLSSLTGELGLSKKVTNAETNRPGLALSGFIERFSNNRVQVVGETEMTYLRSLMVKERSQALNHIFEKNIPCLVITKNMDLPSELVGIAKKNETTVLRTSLSTDAFLHSLVEYLEPIFAPKTTIHGALVDVYGVGLLFTGRSGIGKSEAALDLVERGHRLVADDVVTAYRMRQGVLMGTSNSVTQHFMEIRGVGIIDVTTMFGIRSIRMRKRIEVVVNLEDWKDHGDYERTALGDKTTNLLDTELSYVRIPINPGKNLTVISEVVALRHLLKGVGVNPAAALNQRLLDTMKETERIKNRREDYE
tara:strand:- start:182110 stop:183075 length:966 start_codon:yes stop_codon:yes gene_type:complete